MEEKTVVNKTELINNLINKFKTFNIVNSILYSANNNYGEILVVYNMDPFYLSKTNNAINPLNERNEIIILSSKATSTLSNQKIQFKVVNEECFHNKENTNTNCKSQLINSRILFDRFGEITKLKTQLLTSEEHNTSVNHYNIILEDNPKR